MATSTTPLLRRPRNAPHGLDEIVGHDPHGVPVTAEDRIVSAVAAGNYIEAAAASANVGKVTMYEWLKQGAAANAKLATNKRVTRVERRLAAFADRVFQAEGEAEVHTIGAIASLARGGIPMVETTTRTDSAGKQTVTVKESTLPPNAVAATWHADRRWSPRWTRRQQLEVTGAGGGPVQVASPLAAIMGELDAMARRADAASEPADPETTG